MEAEAEHVLEFGEGPGISAGASEQCLGIARRARKASYSENGKSAFDFLLELGKPTESGRSELQVRRGDPHARGCR